MAVEAKRGCGYRKVGGTYMVSAIGLQACDRLPFELTVCDCCGEGYRASRSLREVSPYLLFKGRHDPCGCSQTCYICNPKWPRNEDQHSDYLEWVGGSYYKNPELFIEEANSLGISRRLKGGIPRRMVVGKSIVLLAHRDILFQRKKEQGGIQRRGWLFEKGKGVFSAFVVNSLQHICTESEMALKNRVQEDKQILEMFEEPLISRIKQLINLESRGVELIPVPDNDKDHR